MITLLKHKPGQRGTRFLILNRGIRVHYRNDETTCTQVKTSELIAGQKECSPPPPRGLV